MENKNVWETYSVAQLQELEDHAKEYMDFLDRGKTERECVRRSLRHGAADADC